MEIIIIVAVVIAAYLVYSIIREKGTGLDLNNDGKVDAADLKVLGTEAKAKVETVAAIVEDKVGEVAKAVKKGTTKKAPAVKKTTN